jgi:rRNA maturation endonuclease Nob1
MGYTCYCDYEFVSSDMADSEENIVYIADDGNSYDDPIYAPDGVECTKITTIIEHYECPECGHQMSFKKEPIKEKL